MSRRPDSWEDPPEDEPEHDESDDLFIEPEDLNWDTPTQFPYNRVNRDPVDYIYDPLRRYDNV